MKKLNILILLSVFTSTSLIIPKAETTVLDNIPYINEYRFKYMLDR